MNKDENQFDTELNEILYGAFVGHWVRDENGDFVSLDDKYNVLKDYLRSELEAWNQVEVAKAKIEAVTQYKRQKSCAHKQSHLKGNMVVCDKCGLELGLVTAEVQSDE